MLENHIGNREYKPYTENEGILHRKGITVKKRENTYQVWALAIPIAFESFFQMLFGFADTYVLGQYADQAVAAAGYVNQFLSIVLLIFRVVSAGTSILLAQAIGADDDEKQKSICGAAFWLVAAFGLTSFFVIFSLKEDIIYFLQMDRILWEPAIEYLEIMSYGLFFQALFAIFTSVFRSYGKAVFTSVISTVANIWNIIGDILVVNGYLHVWGTVKDVALVTVGANAAAAVAVLVVFLITDKDKIMQKPKRSDLKDILRLGVPAAGESCSYKCSQMVMTMVIGFLGTEALTAKIYAMNFSFMLVLLPNSIAVAAGVIVGVHIGADQRKEAKQVSFSCIRKGTAAVAALGLVFFVFGSKFLGIFTDNESILRMAYLVLLMDMVTMFAKNVNLTLGNSLRAAGDVNYPVAISVISMWGIGTGLAWVLGCALELGLTGIFAAFLIDETLRSFLLWHRWNRRIECPAKKC